ncbi:MAG: prefoldin subunit alpha [Halobacteriales archaeon]|nr:prefoldin subunit alpha [Halobacteriales archaeon]
MATKGPAPPPAPAADPAAAAPEQLMAQMDILQREMARMDRRMAAIEQALMEAQQAAATVQALSEAKGDVEALVPIGGGVHVKARLDAGAQVLLPVGAGYATEAGAAQVAEALRQRVESLSQQFRQANEEAERVAQAAAALNEEMGTQ